MFKRMFGRSKKSQQGAAMVEYAVLIGAVTLVAILGLSVLGHKTNDLTGTLAVILPCAHADDDFVMTAGELIEFQGDASDIAYELDTTAIGGGDSERLGDNTGLGDLDPIIVD